MPRIVNIKHNNVSQSELDTAVDVLREEGLVVAPTETRYGLLALASSQRAVRRLCDAKGREFSQPVAVFVKDLRAASDIAEIPDSARRLAEAFLPGPLTLVLKSKVDWDQPLVVNGKIGVRISSSPVISALVDQTGPLTATSANRSGVGEPDTAEDSARQLGEAVDLYLEAGQLTGKVSTVVDCSGDMYKILRVGAIDPHQIDVALKELQDSE